MPSPAVVKVRTREPFQYRSTDSEGLKPLIEATKELPGVAEPGAKTSCAPLAKALNGLSIGAKIAPTIKPQSTSVRRTCICKTKSPSESVRLVVSHLPSWQAGLMTRPKQGPV